MKTGKTAFKLFIILILVFFLIFGQGLFSGIGKVLDVKYMENFLAFVLPFEKTDSLPLSTALLGFDLRDPHTILKNGIYTANALDNEKPEPTAKPQPSPTPEGAKPVTAGTVGNSSADNVTEDGVAIKNHTSYQLDYDGLINEKLNFTVSENEPSVLIVHTHASESYMPTKQNYYIPSDPSRTEDINFNVVRVGDEIAKSLTDNGVNVLHDKTIHDYPSYNGSYANCRKTVESYLKQYPSIKIVLDVHRDAIEKEDGTKVKLISDIDGEQCAQVMLVVGTDAYGRSHPNWRENLKFAMKLQRRVDLYYPGLMRPIDLREERFNQDTTTASVILEMGTNGNTLEEALSSAKHIGFALSDMMQYMK